MEQAIEQVLNPETSKALIEGGHAWIYAFQLILIAVLVPMAKWFVNYNAKKTAEHNELKKELIDAEREVTKFKRDAENEKTNGRIDALEIKLENKIVNLENSVIAKINEFEYKLENTCRAIERVGNKMDLHFSKAHKSE